MEAVAASSSINRATAQGDRQIRLLVQRYQPRLLNAGVMLAYLLVGGLLTLGWLNRARQPFTAESGIGYYLGIAGGCMMLLLLVYPLRKRVRALRFLGPVAWSFRLHMTLGVLGPTLILFHCGFGLGSLNSNVALLCMLVVAGSGLIGRYFYTRIHHGLYGNRTSLAELQQNAQLLKASLEQRLQTVPGVIERLEQLETWALNAPRGLVQSGWHFFLLNIRTWLIHFRLNSTLKPALQSAVTLSRQEQRELYRELLAHSRAHLESLRKVAGFSFYERLFSLWHLFHLPLFVMLVISGFVHVFAVHAY